MNTFRPFGPGRRSGRSPRGFRPVVISLLVAVLLVAPAGAPAAPFTLGAGRLPDVAMDGDGTAYVVWNGDEPIDTSLHFCRIPRDALIPLHDCYYRTTLKSPGGDSVTRPHVFVSGITPNAVTRQYTIRVLAYRYGTPQGSHDFLWTSTDSGRTFGPPAPVGSLPLTGDAALGPGNSISIVTQAAGMGSYQRVSLNGTGNPPVATISAPDEYGGSVGLLSPALPLAVFAGGSPAQVRFSLYKGSGDVNDGFDWTRELEQRAMPGLYPHLAGGPSGLWLLSGREGSLTVSRYLTGERRFANRGLGDNQYRVAFGPNAQSALAQDKTGRLFVVYEGGAGLHAMTIATDQAPHSDDYLYGTQLIDSQDFEVADPDGVSAPRIAVAGDHLGLAVWVAGTGAGGSGAPEVHAAVIDGRPLLRVEVPRRAVYADGRIELGLRCASSTLCAGVITASVRAPIGAASAAKLPRTRTVTLGRARFAIRAHRTARVRVRVSPQGRRLLRRYRIRRLTVTLVSKPRKGQRTTIARTIRLSPPHRHARRR
jgi:hypothetical protein